MVGVKFPDKLMVGTRNQGGKELRLAHDEQLAVLRKKLKIPDDFLENNFDHAKMLPGGGKGGDCMAMTKDKRWFIKDLNPGDFAALMTPRFLEQYREHVTPKPGPGGQDRHSLICKIVAILDDPSRPHGRMVVMSNCLPQLSKDWAHMQEARDGVPPKADAFGWTYLMDLKGNRDDKLMQKDGYPVAQVHKRCWQCHWLAGEACGCPNLCCLTPERSMYYDGKEEAFNYKFHLLPEDARRLRQTVREDVAFFQKVGLMDYSAIIGAVKLRADAEPPQPKEGDLYARAFVATDPTGGPGKQRWAFYWGIIDFLQLWTTGKKVAHCIKCVFAPKPISTIAPPEYGDQFLQLVDERVKEDGERSPPPDNSSSPRQDEHEPLAWGGEGAAAAAPAPGGGGGGPRTAPNMQ